MTPVDPRRLQAKLGVVVDGDLGPASFAELFVKCGAPRDLANELGIGAAVHFPTYGLLDSTPRLAHFLAQLGHESDGFRAMEEYASGAAYEGRKDLGNVVAGDGQRYKGRGPIQITGRANYRRYGRRIGIDIERHPEIAAIPSIGLHLALEYWSTNKLNDLADADDCKGITRRINGGENGYDDRCARLTKAKALLG